MPEPIAVGDTFAVTAGCDKRFADLPRPIRQRHQFSRLSAYSRQRLRRELPASGSSPATTARAGKVELCQFAGKISSRKREAGSARPIGIKPRSRSRLRLPRPGARRVARRDRSRSRKLRRLMRPTGRKRAGAESWPKPRRVISRQSDA